MHLRVPEAVQVIDREAVIEVQLVKPKLIQDLNLGKMQSFICQPGLDPHACQTKYPHPIGTFIITHL